MQKKYDRILKIFLLILMFFGLSLSIFLLIQQINTQKNIEAILKQEENLITLIKKGNSDIQLILRGLIAEKAEILTRDKNTTEEKIIAIAEWVSANIMNRHIVADPLSDWTSDNNVGEGVYAYFVLRKGACGPRSSIFIEMLKYINIPARRYNICCFPTSDLRHSCVHVYYDKSWHFFDVTYAGYFKKNKKILSFEEVIELAKKEANYLKYLTVFPKNSDYYGKTLTTLAKVDNAERMSWVYARERLKMRRNMVIIPVVALNNVVNKVFSIRTIKSEGLQSADADLG